MRVFRVGLLLAFRIALALGLDLVHVVVLFVIALICFLVFVLRGNVRGLFDIVVVRHHSFTGSWALIILVPVG
jgi:hypothetical protein